MSTETPPPDSVEPQELDEAAERSLGPSRSQVKRDAAAIAELGLKLTKLGKAALLALPMSDQVRKAIFDCQQMQRNARARQLRLVAKLLRESDTAPLVEALSNPSGRTRNMDDLEHTFLLERGRLLEGGDAALAEFLVKHPQADRQRLRQLVRQAGRQPPDERSKKAGRDVLRMIRELHGSDPEDLADTPANT